MFETYPKQGLTSIFSRLPHKVFTKVGDLTKIRTKAKGSQNEHTNKMFIYTESNALAEGRSDPDNCMNIRNKKPALVSGNYVALFPHF